MVRISLILDKTRYNFSIQFSSIYKSKIIACVSLVVARIIREANFSLHVHKYGLYTRFDGRDETSRLVNE